MEEVKNAIPTIAIIDIAATSMIGVALVQSDTVAVLIAATASVALGMIYCDIALRHNGHK